VEIITDPVVEYGIAKFTLAPDLFATDGAGFGAFRKALWSENRFAPEAFQNRQNFFGGNNVTAIVLEVPSSPGREREGKLANTMIDGEYNLSGQELPLSIMRLYLPPHGQIRQCCSETQNRDYLL
jgi:hypothetical protein